MPSGRRRHSVPATDPHDSRPPSPATAREAGGGRAPTAIVERMVTHTGRVFRVESLIVEEADGRRRRRDVVRHPGAVTVIAELEDGRLVMIRNWRVAVERRLLEFCAGKLEPGEDPRAAAGRELEEECGYRAASVERLGSFYTSPGFADELMHVYLATGLQPVPRRLEPGEDIDVELIPATSIPELIRDGHLVDGKSIAAWSLRACRAATEATHGP